MLRYKTNDGIRQNFAKTFNTLNTKRKKGFSETFSLLRKNNNQTKSLIKYGK